MAFVPLREIVDSVIKQVFGNSRFGATIQWKKFVQYSIRNGGSIGLSSVVVELELQEQPLKDEFQASKIADELPDIAKVILRLSPIWTMLLMFAVSFQQPPTFFTKQCMAMSHTLGVSPPPLPLPHCYICDVFLMKIIKIFLRSCSLHITTCWTPLHPRISQMADWLRREFVTALQRLRGNNSDISAEAEEIKQFTKILQSLLHGRILDLF